MSKLLTRIHLTLIENGFIKDLFNMNDQNLTFLQDPLFSFLLTASHTTVYDFLQRLHLS